MVKKFELSRFDDFLLWIIEILIHWSNGDFAGTKGKVWIIEKFELSRFELTRVDCTWFSAENKLVFVIVVFAKLE